MTDIVDRLRAACVGHPHAKVAWPHYLLHQAADEIERLEARIKELEAEIKRLREENTLLSQAMGAYTLDRFVAYEERIKELEAEVSDLKTHITSLHRRLWQTRARMREIKEIANEALKDQNDG